MSNINKKILIVEDEVSLVKAVKNKLENKNHFEIEIAKDGQEALEKLNQSIPDLILLDILMPKISGFEFIEIVKNNPKFKDVKILIFSNMLSNQSDIDRGLALGALEFIDKSEVTIENLTNKIIQYLN